MSSKKFADYYPNKLAQQYEFERRQNNIKKFDHYRASFPLDRKFIPDAEKDKFLKHKLKQLPDKITEEYIAREYNIWDSWQKNGKNIFHFSSTLLEMLKHTDVSNTELPLIKLPYEELYIDISDANMFFDDKLSVPVEGVFIGEDINQPDFEEATYERVISFDFTGSYIRNYKHINEKLMEYMRGFHSYSLYFDPHLNITNIGQSIADAKDMFIKGGPAYDDSNINNKIFRLHSDFIDQTLNLVINCLLYLSQSKKDVKEEFTSDLPVMLKDKLAKANTEKRKRVVLNEIKQGGFTKINLVGSQIHNNRAYPTNGNIISPHWRRGHWRNQKFGVQLTENKLIWIMPTIVNAEKGQPEKGHVYSADK